MTTLANITGITRDAFKHTNLTAAQYDGEARPGELVVDLGSYQLYIGNVDGNLNLVGGSGGTYSNANVAAYLPIHTGNISANYYFGNGSQLTGIITTVLPNALSNTIHIAANTVGNTATIITDATTANTANTIVVRDGNGSINVNAWAVNTHLVSANYAVSSSDYWIGLTAKNLTITLPGTATNGRQYIIADTVGSGNPDIHIIADPPANVFNGALSQQSHTLTATYISGTWYCNT
jgi:hypothetical protein